MKMFFLFSWGFIKGLFRGLYIRPTLRVSVVSDGIHPKSKLTILNARDGVDVCPHLFRIGQDVFLLTKGVTYNFVLIPASDWCKIKLVENLNIDQVFHCARIKGLVTPNLEATILLCEKLASDLSYPKSITIFHKPIGIIKSAPGSVIQIERELALTRIMPVTNGSWGNGEYLAFILPNQPIETEPVCKTPSWAIGGY